MNQHRRIPTTYDPATDSDLVLWIDPSDSSTASLLDTGGTSISNGETIGTVKSKKGTARNFTQWMGNPRPTWDSAGINGLGAMRFNNQVLATQTSMSEFNSMAGMTIMAVHKTVVAGGGGGGSDCIFTSTQADSIGGSHFRSQTYVATRNDAVNRVGGRRLIGQSFQYITSTIVPHSLGSVVTGVFDWANARASSYEGGVQDHMNQSFQNAGNTEATEPFAIGLGAVPQEVGIYTDVCNAFIGEILVWKSARTPDQLFTAHHYMRRKWTLT